MNGKWFGFVVVAVFFFSFSLMAQDNNSGQTPGETPTANSGQETLRGCLTGGAGTYMLLDQATGVAYILNSGGDLSKQVNHDVTVTGQPVVEVSHSQSNVASSAVPPTVNNFRVQSVHETADYCQPQSAH
jgi:hypothetical protein